MFWLGFGCFLVLLLLLICACCCRFLKTLSVLSDAVLDRIRLFLKAAARPSDADQNYIRKPDLDRIRWTFFPLVTLDFRTDLEQFFTLKHFELYEYIYELLYKSSFKKLPTKLIPFKHKHIQSIYIYTFILSGFTIDRPEGC